MQPLKARQWCKALQRRKQESRNMKALETVQIEEQLLHSITCPSSKAFPAACRAFPCTPSPSSVKTVKLQFQNISHGNSLHNWPTTCLHFLISYHKDKDHKTPMAVSIAQSERNEETTTQLMARGGLRWVTSGTDWIQTKWEILRQTW